MAKEGQLIGIHSAKDFQSELDLGAAAGKLIVVDFTASWCPPCRFIAPIFLDLAKAHASAIFLKVDVDEVKEIAEKYEVTAMPTFIFLKGGVEIHRIIGADKVELGKKVLEFNTPAATSTA